jgi:hypothetical protein
VTEGGLLHRSHLILPHLALSYGALTTNQFLSPPFETQSEPRAAISRLRGAASELHVKPAACETACRVSSGIFISMTVNINRLWKCSEKLPKFLFISIRRISRLGTTDWCSLIKSFSNGCRAILGQAKVSSIAGLAWIVSRAGPLFRPSVRFVVDRPLSMFCQAAEY